MQFEETKSKFKISTEEISKSQKHNYDKRTEKKFININSYEGNESKTPSKLYESLKAERDELEIKLKEADLTLNKLNDYLRYYLLILEIKMKK